MGVGSLGQEYSLQKGMVTYCSILAWKIPWIEEPGGLVYRVAESDTTEATQHAFIHLNELEST